MGLYRSTKLTLLWGQISIHSQVWYLSQLPCALVTASFSCVYLCMWYDHVAEVTKRI